MVYENANQLVADCLVHERCGNGRVNSTAQATDNAIVADLRANLLYLLGNYVARIPGRWNASDLVQKVLENVLSKSGVLNFWVPLHSVNFLLTVCKSCNRSCVCRCQNFETCRRLHNLIAV